MADVEGYPQGATDQLPAAGAREGTAGDEPASATHADLTGTTMIQADLSRADLPGTDLTGSNITNADLRAACYDDSTKWPDTYQPEDPPDCSTASAYP